MYTYIYKQKYLYPTFIIFFQQMPIYINKISFLKNFYMLQK